MGERKKVTGCNQFKSRFGNISTTGKKGKVTIGGKTFFARSSWEANIASYFEFLKGRGEIKEWQHEPDEFWFYEIKRGTRSYLPDFKITRNDDTIYYVEVKGYMDKKSKTKLNRMKKYYPKIELEVLGRTRYNSIKKFSRIIENWGLLD